VSNLTGLAFRNSVGKLISNVTLNSSTQPSGILYFAFLSCVNPCTTNPCLTLAVITVDFCLAFPNPLFLLTPRKFCFPHLTQL
jgi:hypothetical protein